MTNEEKAAVKTLKHLGYTYHGGELWKPPLGKPAQRKSLTDEQIEQVFKKHAGYGGDDFISFARAIEAALE